MRHRVTAKLADTQYAEPVPERDIPLMRYTLPWFFCPSKRVAQKPGAAVTDHQERGSAEDAFRIRLRTARALIHALIVRTLRL
eukprot:5774097-Prymnesium_polylepis.1